MDHMTDNLKIGLYIAIYVRILEPVNPYVDQSTSRPIWYCHTNPVGAELIALNQPIRSKTFLYTRDIKKRKEKRLEKEQASKK